MILYKIPGINTHHLMIVFAFKRRNGTHLDQKKLDPNMGSHSHILSPHVDKHIIFIKKFLEVFGHFVLACGHLDSEDLVILGLDALDCNGIQGC